MIKIIKIHPPVSIAKYNEFANSPKFGRRASGARTELMKSLEKIAVRAWVSVEVDDAKKLASLYNANNKYIIRTEGVLPNGNRLAKIMKGPAK